MDHWFEAYSTWPPINQMIFSIIVVIVGLVLCFLLGIWLLRIFDDVAVWLRGWPPEEREVKNEFAEVTGLLRQISVQLSVCHDQREEQRKQREEEIEYQAKLQGELEQAKTKEKT